MEYYSSVKRNENLIHAIIWVDSENILLGRKVRHRKTNIVFFHLYQVPRLDKYIEIESRMGFLGGSVVKNPPAIQEMQL